MFNKINLYYLLLLFLCFFVFKQVDSFSRKRDTSRDFYKILGVPRTASDKEIKKRYRELSKEYHPDLNTSKKAETNYLNIRDANEVLTNPEKRKLYDKYGEAGLDPNFQATRDHSERHGFSSGGNFFYFDGMDFDFGDGMPMFKQGRHTQRQSNLFDEDSEVLLLNRQTFSNSINNREWIMLVNFYSPRCGGCQKFKEPYINIAKSYKDIFPVAAVNCLKFSHLCDNAGVEKMPSLFLYLDNNTKKPIQYLGTKSEAKIKSWLIKQLPTYGTSLDTDNFESWIITDSNKPKVLIVTEKTSIPIIVRATVRGFALQISIGYLLLGTPEGLRVKKKFLQNWKDPPNFPALLHITDIDEITGEWTKLETRSTTLLSLVMSRILAQTRRNRKLGQKISELTPRKFARGDCGKNEERICILAMFAGGIEPKLEHMIQDIQNVLEKYKTDGLKGFWVNCAKNTKFGNFFDFNPNLEQCAKANIEDYKEKCFQLIAYRPKKQKYEKSKDTSFSVDKFLDSILSFGSPFSRKMAQLAEL